MFTLEYLKLLQHPQLGDIEVVFVESKESQSRKKPYTSIVIGPNGTGKSYILREVAEIFRKIRELAEKGTKLSLPYRIHIRYRIDNDCFEIISRQLQMLEKASKNSALRYFKNRPNDHRFINDNIPFDEKTDFDIDLSSLKFPSKILTVSFIHNDRFTFKSSDPTEFYQYLGLRSGRGSTSTKATQKNVIKNLFGATGLNQDFILNLKGLLEFLEFEQLFKVQYTTRYTDLFFSGRLNSKDFCQFYERWWDEDFKYSSRKKENPPWSKAYYDRIFKGDQEKIDSIINYLNKISSDGKTLKKKTGASSKSFTVDFFGGSMSNTELETIQHLESLDVFELEGIKVKKADSEFSTSAISSGESTLLLSIVNIFSRIEANSLILIDEPEISLHPNWQMRYISFLKTAFSSFTNCHFVITTHSHFLVSDLEGPSSSITTLVRHEENPSQIVARLLEGKNTFGWSAEEVLYSVFKVRTTRNFYIERDLRELLHKISIKSLEKSRMQEILSNLKQFELTDSDPLNLVIQKAEEYLSND